MLNITENNLVIVEIGNNFEVSLSTLEKMLNDTFTHGVFSHNLFHLLVCVSETQIKNLDHTLISELSNFSIMYGLQAHLVSVAHDEAKILPFSKIYIVDGNVLFEDNTTKVVSIHCEKSHKQELSKIVENYVSIISNKHLSIFIHSAECKQYLNDWIDANNPKLMVQPFAGILNWISSNGVVDLYLVVWAYLYHNESKLSLSELLNGLYTIIQHEPFILIKSIKTPSRIPTHYHKIISDFKARISTNEN